jgi:transposase
VRNVPGRKTDMNDATWLADLLAHGLVRGSFVPEAPVQRLRDLTRTRKQFVRQIAQHTHRIQKTLQDANVKLTSVLTDTLGKSGRRILKALVNGETNALTLAALAHKQVKASPEAIADARAGRVTDDHRFLLRLHLQQIDALEAAVAQLEDRIGEQCDPFQDAVVRLTSIPGISHTAAHVLIAEIGPDMSRFPSSAHLVSWAGLCPRSDESAGKRRSTRIRDGNAWLKPLLVQTAWAASRSKDSYLRAQFHRLKARRGAKKAIVAVAASLLTIAFHLLRDGTLYKDLGSNHFDQRDKNRVTKRLLKRLADLGVEVEVKAA